MSCLEENYLPFRRSSFAFMRRLCLSFWPALCFTFTFYAPSWLSLNLTLIPVAQRLHQSRCGGWRSLSNLPAHFQHSLRRRLLFLRRRSFLLKVYLAEARGMIKILHWPNRMRRITASEWLDPSVFVCVFVCQFIPWGYHKQMQYYCKCTM